MILAFGNKARHGKDTAGEAVVDYYNNERAIRIQHGVAPSPAAKIFKFADALYKVCREEYGMTDKDGPLLQKIGDGRREEFGQDYWIKKLAESISKFSGHAIITDIRYINEADWVKSISGFVVNVSRLNLDGTPYVTTDRDPNFISEVQLDGYNFDAYIKVREGDAALTAELAITIAEYFNSLTRRK